SIMNLLRSVNYSYGQSISPYYVSIIYPTNVASYDYAAGSQVNTTYTYDYYYPGTLDNCGMPDVVTTDISNGQEVTEQRFQYDLYAAPYNRSKPVYTLTYKTRGSEPTHYEIGQLSYNMQGDLVSKVQNPGDPAHETGLFYTYDALGNVSQ